MSKSAIWPVVLAFAAVILTAAPCQAVNGTTCIDWPRTMAKYEVDNLPNGTSVLIHPFTDYTKRAGDEWLVLGLRDLIADMLRTGKEARILAGPTAIYGPDTPPPPNYIIGGSFKHTPQMLSVYIMLSAGSTAQLLKQYEVAIPYPENRDFFGKLAGAAEELMKEMKISYDRDNLNSVRDATASTEAYEHYAKGRQSLESYNIKLADIAAIWFTQSKRADYRSHLGYDGMIDLYTFMGFYHKQMRDPFGTYYQKAENELLEMAKLAKPEPLILPKKNTKVLKKGGGKPLKIENRFLVSNVAFSEGLHAAQLGDWSQAASNFRRALESMPEDATTWYHLARMEEKLGHSNKANEAMQKALTINPCMDRL